jgi:hypothetical protein
MFQNLKEYSGAKGLKYLVLLLHVSLHLDHHQGAIAEPCQSYSYVVIIS